MSTPPPTEGFQPRAHWAPTTPLRRLLFALRLTADLQTNTIHRDLRRELTGFSGRLLDIGCGNSPFRHLLDPTRTQYQGIDVEQASSFGYRNPDTVYYDGKTIPFADASFDAALCTEVMEHVPDPGPFVSEMYRVLKPGGLAVVTIPWSARFHYQPHDYHRYTPSMLRLIFAPFSECSIRPRGTDFSSIASKIVVAYVRNLLRLKPATLGGVLLIPFRLLAALMGMPVLLGALGLGHGGILFGLGSTDDPLGYTLILRK
ncbi:methyltransferase domain-containing protein [Opitutaceae bacterium]